ncbi:cell division control protein 48 homolog C-like isoform X2 [Carica papaya]|uniref:cell division control protein 48 homolog C-like isoform X2 n=1 Tax=Carica papaya TaxID=3649 RepID=UPI000B8C71A3|nr:cell division control protein 48 homolog C-like isoform X2 [Carica papaya]
MGKKTGSSSRSSVVSPKILNLRIDSCKHKYSTSDEVVEYLRSNFSEYARLKHLPLKRRVEQILQSRNTPFIFQRQDHEGDDDDDDGDEQVDLSRKKRSRALESEHRLQNLENLHLQRRRAHACRDASSDEEDGSVSTSEDAVYGQKLEPQFDLTKSMLRANYSASNKKPKPTAEEKNVEVEIASEKMKIKMDMNPSIKKDAKASVSSGCGRVLEGTGKRGPRFSDLGGLRSVLEELMMEVIIPLHHPQLPQWLGVRPIAGILLHGPPGCGKTKLANAIANETGVPFYQISATEVVSGVSGASEENVRELFSKAYRTAPSIVFIDEIDAIASKRENLQREMERRIVTQLITCMDESHRLGLPRDKDPNTAKSDSLPGYVLVIGATNRPDVVDPALRRPGRFDREIVLGVPDEIARVEILSVLTRNLRLECSFDLVKIARLTPGFVGADLAALANKAGNLAMKRIIDTRKSELSRDSIDEEHNDEWWRQPWLPEEMEKLTISLADFEEAAKMVQPSSRREGFSTIPNVKWEDVGGLNGLRQEFDRYIVRHIKFPEDYMEFGVDMETGFLLYGPPGCGKTLIAKAVANEAGANFIHIKVDALTTKRGKEGGWVVERLLNQLLIELDGAEQRRGVFVIGATNRIDVIDRAVLRPGRFGKLLYVPLPSPDERGLILKALGRKKPIDSSVDLSAIGRMETCQNFSGADLAALINEAAMAALEDKLTSSMSCSDQTPWMIKTIHFELALKKVSASVSEKQNLYYQALSEKYKTA